MEILSLNTKHWASFLWGIHLNLSNIPSPNIFRTQAPHITNDKKGIGTRYFLSRCGSPNWARTSDIMINSHALYRLSYRGTILAMTYLPSKRPASIVGAEGLNFCVRDGNRCDPFAIVTRIFNSLSLLLAPSKLHSNFLSLTSSLPSLSLPLG